MGIEFGNKKIAMLSVAGRIHGARCAGYIVNPQGQGAIVPQIGGISYNVPLGSSVYRFAANHVEPGASVSHENREDNDALCGLACIGNTAIVTSGDAKGARGIVCGKHVSMEYRLYNLIVDFPQPVIEKLCVNDTILVKAYGQGLELKNPLILAENIDPSLLEVMDITTGADGRIHVPVAATVPALLMGYKVGLRTSVFDYDIMTDDPALLEAQGLAGLRIGDVVLIKDFDASYSAGVYEGAASVGVVVTGDSLRTGHGPGVVMILSSRQGQICAVPDKSANLAKHFEILRKRRGA